MSFPGTPTSYGPSPEEPLGHPSAWPSPATTPVQVRTLRRGVLIAAALAVFVLMAGTGFGVWLFTRPETARPTAVGTSGSGTLEVTGMVTLQHSQFRWNGRADPTCMGWQGFDDIRGGTQVTISAASGKVLAVGSLDTGTAMGITTEANGLPRAELCSIPFKVSGVPRGVGPYGVEVGHRGVLRYNESDLSGLQLGFS